MITSTKKRSYLFSLMVSVVVLTLCSAAWSQTERLTSYMTNTYQLNFFLPSIDSAQDYLDLEINPILAGAGQEPLLATSTGLLSILDRDNLRGDDGRFISSGEDVVVTLFLVVIDPAAPSPPGMSILLVEAFYSNANIISYLVGKGLVDPEHHVSAVKITHEFEREEKTKIKGITEVWDEEGTVEFNAKFIAPEPYGEPPVISGPDIVAEIPYRLRYAYAPERIFAISLFRKVYEPPVVDALRNLEIDVSAIFNSLNETNVYRFRFMHQFTVIDEISP